jgi:hypothetical protein
VGDVRFIGMSNRSSVITYQAQTMEATFPTTAKGFMRLEFSR